jgi:hypothetical protein
VGENIKMDLRDIGIDGVNWIWLALLPQQTNIIRINKYLM